VSHHLTDLPPDLQAALEAATDLARTLNELNRVATILPHGADGPLLPIPAEIEVTERDLDQAADAWDMFAKGTELEGLLRSDVVDPHD